MYKLMYRYMKVFFVFRSVLFVCCLFVVGRGVACTNIIVGREASVDGSVFVSYSADDFGSFGFMKHFPAGAHAKGEMRAVYDGETNNYLGEIPEAEYTYNVVGYMNEYQLTITETTFGGREELVDTGGILDYVSLIEVALQRCRSAREAIELMGCLVAEYGYRSEGESFSVADKNEAWIMEIIGKGSGEKGAVWVAVRIPDDCICAHANQSRIRRFALDDPANCLYSDDVIEVARRRGYYSGVDEDFSFADAYCPVDFSGLRFCEARVWSFFNRWASVDMSPYLDYVSGYDLDGVPMPLFVRPRVRLSLSDVIDVMRDHYEGTPFALDNDPGKGPYDSPYRPTPLVWEVDSVKYFNERPISTQQSAFVMVAQMRRDLPDYVGGVDWIGFDDANMVCFTPVYCCTTIVPDCFGIRVADGLNFSLRSAYWLANCVSSFVRPRYSLVFEELRSVRDGLDKEMQGLQSLVEGKALELGVDEGRRFLTDYVNRSADGMMRAWGDLFGLLMVKYVDGVVRPQNEDGSFTRTAGGWGVHTVRPGFPTAYRREILRQTGDRFRIPVD